jgi:hypothetical protein
MQQHCKYILSGRTTQHIHATAFKKSHNFIFFSTHAVFNKFTNNYVNTAMIKHSRTSIGVFAAVPSRGSPVKNK